jgi:hypothetical protein
LARRVGGGLTVPNEEQHAQREPLGRTRMRPHWSQVTIVSAG